MCSLSGHCLYMRNWRYLEGREGNTERQIHRQRYRDKRWEREIVTEEQERERDRNVT